MITSLFFTALLVLLIGFYCSPYEIMIDNEED